MILLIFLLLIFYNVNIQDNLFNDRATIIATIYNNNNYNLSFNYCIIHGLIMSPITRIIMTNTTQDLIMWALLNDTSFINGYCSYSMIYNNIKYDTLQLYFYNNILLDLEYYGMVTNYEYKNNTNNYKPGYVNYILEN